MGKRRRLYQSEFGRQQVDLAPARRLPQELA
jgi:hypothetical protein